MKWELGKIETITLSDTEINCKSNAQKKETQNPHTTQTKNQVTNQPVDQ